MNKTICKILTICFVFLFAGGYTTPQTNEVPESPIFVSNLSLSAVSSGDCEGSCLSAEMWQYCVAYSEFVFGQRNRTAEEEDEEVDQIT